MFRTSHSKLECSSRTDDDNLGEGVLIISMCKRVRNVMILGVSYDSAGCPVSPVAFSGMTGRLGNIITTYVHFIALQYRLGFQYFLPLYTDT